MSEEEFDELLDLMSENNLTQHGADTLYGEIVDREIKRIQLKQELQQKENIIKEVREMVNKLKNETLIEDTGNTTTALLYAKPCCRKRLNKIEEILDKVSDE